MNGAEGPDGEAVVPDDADTFGLPREAATSRHVRGGVVAAGAGVLVTLLVIVVGVALWRKVMAPSMEALSALEEQGGIVLVLVPSPDAGETVTDDLIARTAAVLGDRIDALGVEQAEIVARGQGEATTFTLTLVGLNDTHAVRALIRQGALDLRPVALADWGTSPTPTSSSVSPPLQSETDSAALRSSFAAADCRSPGSREPGVAQDHARWLIACTARGDMKYLLEPAAVDGSNIDTVRVIPAAGNDSQQIEVRFDTSGAQALAETSSRLASREAPANEIAIVLDSVVISTPYFSEPVLNGAVWIDGTFTDAEARELADLLDHGALPFRLKDTELRVVPARSRPADSAAPDRPVTGRWSPASPPANAA